MTGSTRCERITIQAAAETADSQGGASVAWSTLADVWAELVPLGANERSQAEAMGATMLYRFRVRTRADVSPAMRVQWTPRWSPSQTAQTLEIHGVTHEPQRATMLIDCGVRS